jgi:toxin YoeB
MLEVFFTTRAQEDYDYFLMIKPALCLKIDSLVAAICRDPFKGIGKPEPLKFDLSSYWSRRINREHRLVYKVFEDVVYIAQCRYHY